MYDSKNPHDASRAFAVTTARRLLAEADAVDMGSPESMARAIGKLSVAVELLLERMGGASE